MQWAFITGDWRYEQSDDQPGVWKDPPRTGSLPVHQTQRLVGLLATQTSTVSRCWFAVWEGFGALALTRDASIDRLQMPQRPMLLMTGPLDAAVTSLTVEPFDQRASLWWPDDRSWCVATDVDLMTTFVGGSRACIEMLLGDDQLEVMDVSVDQSLTSHSDHLNPPPTGRVR